MEPFGKLAYDAARQHLASNTEPGQEYDASDWPEWNNLLPVQREAWEAAAQAVRDF